MSVVDMARKFLYVREAKVQNTGQRVEGIQRWCGGVPGDSWCAYFVTFILDICYQGSAPVPRTGSCDDILALARSRGWTVPTPAPGDIFLRVRNGNDAHHTGFVTDVRPYNWIGIAGNTSQDGHSSNGTGVFENTFDFRDDLIFVRLP